MTASSRQDLIAYSEPSEGNSQSEYERIREVLKYGDRFGGQELIRILEHGDWASIVAIILNELEHATPAERKLQDEVDRMIEGYADERG